MFCGNCGSEIPEGLVNCPKCSTSPNRVDSNGGPMVRFVRKAFRNFLEAILWINLISFTISGWNTGVLIRDILELVERKKISAVGYPFLGAFLGILAGLLVNIIVGGLIATITNIDDKIENINGDVKILKDRITKYD